MQSLRDTWSTTSLPTPNSLLSPLCIVKAINLKHAHLGMPVSSSHTPDNNGHDVVGFVNCFSAHPHTHTHTHTHTQPQVSRRLLSSSCLCSTGRKSTTSPTGDSPSRANADLLSPRDDISTQRLSRDCKVCFCSSFFFSFPRWCVYMALGQRRNALPTELIHRLPCASAGRGFCEVWISHEKHGCCCC